MSLALSEKLVRTSGNYKNMNMQKERNDDLIVESSFQKKIRKIRGVVVKAKRETKDTWTLDLFVSEQDKDYLAGQFISISPHQFPELKDIIKFFEYQKGKKEVVRAYSLTSAPHEKYLSITIKPEKYEPLPEAYPPLLSPILASDMLVGREIEFIGYAGAYVMSPDLAQDCSHAVHLVAGSGIVPSFSIIKDELISKSNLHMKHTLIYVNRSFKDIIFHKELLDLKKEYPTRLFVKHFLSKENSNNTLDESYIYGRPSYEHVERLIESPKDALFFACGPAITKWQKKHALITKIPPQPRFMEWVYDLLLKLEVDKKRIKREVYG